MRAEQYVPNADMIVVANLAKMIAHRCLDITIKVKFVACKEANTLAQYGDRTLTFNVSQLGEQWFKPRLDAIIIDLIIHELGHEYGWHTETRYQDAITKIAGRLTILALEEPKVFEV